MDDRRRIFSCRPTTESTKARWYRRGLKWVSGGSVPRRIRIAQSKLAGARTKIPPRTVALTIADALMSATLLVYDRWAVRLNLFSPLEFIPGGSTA
ncbi:hypothetical protein J8273_7449 [Carpediemonas membranifera]|uniref:Uncharacterized protein n=1 Tax=Carpediemonas membranifera TaxID=201153 RepID=A0A8J6ASF5_9EUKA|nr:hypothetical protein J8273_7449 [Carpediemonas membranifera]|eukprot:KAG9391175.1 hypothetical protein J8273_7449 [Carpediemonas membranifera]